MKYEFHPSDIRIIKRNGIWGAYINLPEYSTQLLLSMYEDFTFISSLLAAEVLVHELNHINRINHVN